MTVFIKASGLPFWHHQLIAVCWKSRCNGFLSVHKIVKLVVWKCYIYVTADICDGNKNKIYMYVVVYLEILTLYCYSIVANTLQLRSSLITSVWRSYGYFAISQDCTRGSDLTIGHLPRPMSHVATILNFFTLLVISITRLVAQRVTSHKPWSV